MDDPDFREGEAMGRVALITGANKGIGFEIARGPAASGTTVLLGCRAAARGNAAVEALRADGYDARALLLDVE